MKKLLVIGIVLGLLIASIPSAVGAQDWGSCCDYEGCCWRMCCAEQTYWYRVSYHERVESGFFTPWGTPMYNSVYTHKYVEARNSDEAAASLGFRAGYSAFVARMLDYDGS